VLATVSIMGVIPAATLSRSNAPFADAAREIFGSSMLGASHQKIVAIVAMISTFGALNGWILIQGRVSLAAAQDGLFPRPFAQVSGTRKTPVVGLLVSSVLVSLLLGMNYQSSLADTFTKVIILATLTTLVPYAFTAAAQLMLMFREPERFSGRRLTLDATPRACELLPRWRPSARCCGTLPQLDSPWRPRRPDHHDLLELSQEFILLGAQGVLTQCAAVHQDAN
jgi:APA family basic amino acid/polyamine antiporter